MHLEIIPKHSHGYLSKNISASELHCQCDNVACDFTIYSPLLLERFEQLRSDIGDKVIRILSGYRCDPHNRWVGGVKKSKHLYGAALDLYCPEEVTLIEFGKKAWRHFDYIQVHSDRRFTHVHLNAWENIL